MAPGQASLLLSTSSGYFPSLPNLFYLALATLVFLLTLNSLAHSQFRALERAIPSAWNALLPDILYFLQAFSHKHFAIFSSLYFLPSPLHLTLYNIVAYSWSFSFPRSARKAGILLAFFSTAVSLMPRTVLAHSRCSRNACG